MHELSITRAVRIIKAVVEWAASHTPSRTTDEKELPDIQKITVFGLDKCFMPVI